jgi:hypothetical protein
MFAFQVGGKLNLFQRVNPINRKKNTSMTSRATRQAASFVEERSGVAADKQEPARDPTILLYLLISFTLQSKSLQYSKFIKSDWASASSPADVCVRERPDISEISK